MERPVVAEKMSSRFEMPGFVAGSKRTSRSVSVTALLDLLRRDRGVVQQLHEARLGDSPDFDIFAVGSCRS